MNQAPSVYRARSLKAWNTDREIPGKGWIPCRPLSIGGLKQRVSVAWRVFTGRFDALDWEDQTDVTVTVTRRKDTP